MINLHNGMSSKGNNTTSGIGSILIHDTQKENRLMHEKNG